MSEPKKHILFVDDEPKILAGLRRMLRRFGREWHMEFVESAREALERLTAASFDVVMTDVRMPGMDGAQLLEEVIERYPATVRIILSGQCDRQMVLRCVGPAHQFLTKPCRSETLKSTVARACRLRDHLVDEWKKCMVSQVKSVPSRPSLWGALLAELESGRASIERVAEMVSHDVGMAAKVLQLVSSGFFGTPQRVASPRQAVYLLGLDIIKPLAFSTEAFSPLDADSAELRWLEQMIDHGVAVGRAARAIALLETKDPVLVGDALLAGLLHDIGVPLLAQHLPNRYFSLSTSLHLKRLSFWEVERDVFRAAHTDVGAYLMALWGLPDTIVEAIAHHHVPSLSSSRVFAPLTAVHVANALLEEEIVDLVGMPSPIDMDYLEQIGLPHRVEAWRKACRSIKPEGVLQ